MRAVASVVEKNNGDASDVMPSRIIFARCSDDGFKDDKGRSELQNVFLADGRYLDACATVPRRADRGRAQLG